MSTYRDPLFIAEITSEDNYKDYRLVSVIKAEREYDEYPDVIVEEKILDALGGPGWSRADSDTATKCISQYLRMLAMDLGLKEDQNDE